MTELVSLGVFRCFRWFLVPGATPREEGDVTGDGYPCSLESSTEGEAWAIVEGLGPRLFAIVGWDAADAADAPMRNTEQEGSAMKRPT